MNLFSVQTKSYFTCTVFCGEAIIQNKMSDLEHVPGLVHDFNALLFHSVLNTNATRLWIATHENDVDTVSDLLKNGVDPNIADSKNNQTPLSLAAENGDHILCKKLCENSADPNIPDVRGRTPLNDAMLKDDLELCQLLCDFGADTNFFILSDFKNGDSTLFYGQSKTIRNYLFVSYCAKMEQTLIVRLLMMEQLPFNLLLRPIMCHFVNYC